MKSGRIVRNYLLLPISMGALCCQSWAAAPTQLTAAQIVAKNVAARGGAQAWRAVQSIEFSGTMQAGGHKEPSRSAFVKRSAALDGSALAEQVELPFVMELKRPRKQRLELQFAGSNALQVYDGTKGWKLRPYLNRLEVEPYTAEELKAAASESELDGPLVDYQAKGTRVELEGHEKVEGRDTYRLKLTMKNGSIRHLWIDATSFLETKIEGTPRKLDGANRPVEIYYREYHQVHGLSVPYLLETRVQAVKPVAGSTQISEKIMIHDVVVNPKLEDALFMKPDLHASPATASVAKPHETKAN